MSLSKGNLSDAVGAWFLGPQAENITNLSRFFQLALEYHVDGRTSYYPTDPSMIGDSVKDSDEYQPNPNNVALEASPLTTIIEQTVGLQLCDLVGYETDKEKADRGWGHITCDGSVANLESMWAARNLKFYPFSLKLAMRNELSFIAETFRIRRCSDDEFDAENSPLFNDLDNWSLLNLTPTSVIEIPDRLQHEYGITAAYLNNAMKPYLIQTIGKDQLEKEFQIGTMSYFACETMHYSWPKSAAITGIGSKNVIGIKSGFTARMRIDDLERQLTNCLASKRAVYAVVAIIGSTEHGACDPLMEIVELREKFRKRGLSFVLHADGAWGTYFAATVPEYIRKRVLHGPFTLHGKLKSGVYIPALPLKASTIRSLVHLRYCDSITVDPHKSGYIQYPAGGLLYRDNRMRYLVTWTSPIVYRNDTESIGVYGVEGSKPGAPAVATFFSHHVIGLHKDGYGQLLGQAVFSAVKMYAHLATMSTDDTSFIVRPMNPLPAEVNGDDVEKQKQFIRDHIIKATNEELRSNLPAWDLACRMGSDFAINAFAVNFKYTVDGNEIVNEDVVEANNLNQRIFNRLSIVDIKTKVSDRPLILTSTSLPQANYSEALGLFKSRLGLRGLQDLYTLVNVVMSPWPTTKDLTSTIAADLQKVIQEEVNVSIHRNEVSPDLHGFIMQGTDKLYLVHLAMFNMENHRHQLIITGDLPADIMKKYVAERAAHPSQFYTLGTAHRETLADILRNGEFDAVIDRGLPENPNKHLLSGFKLTNIRVHVDRSLRSKDLLPYPVNTMPFFVYGADEQRHIDHVYTASPNIQLSADQVKIEGLPRRVRAAYAHLRLPEVAMHPFPSNEVRSSKSAAPFFFRPGAIFHDVVFSQDLAGAQLLGRGTLTLTENVFTDTDMLNENPSHLPTTLVAPDEQNSLPYMHHIRMDIPKASPCTPLIRKPGRFQGIVDLVDGLDADSRKELPEEDQVQDHDSD
ncbi:hypothetical protein ONZ45_g7400 [Pleurotus djamor]|nr:hypothetical protein ONZ45_g7400 [Pleurotus djamor]